MTLLFKKHNFYLSLIFSLLLTVISLWIIPIPGKYVSKLMKKERTSTNEILVYNDLDNDGNSELLRFVKDFIGRPALIIENRGKVLFQWNLNGVFARGTFYHCMDADNNGKKEVVIFTCENDSIFMNAIDIQTQEKIVNREFITRYKKTKGRIDFGIHKAITLDVNKDGNNEIIFAVACAFSHISRKLAVFDFKNNTLHISEKAGCHIGWNIQPCDLDDDGKFEFLGNIHSPGNSKIDYPYSDQFSWLMVCDDQMKYKFPPRNIGKYPAFTFESVFQGKEEKCIAIFYNYSGLDDTPFLALYSSQGILIRKKLIKDSVGLRSAVMSVLQGEDNNLIALYRSNGIVEIYNELLEKIAERESSPFLGATMKSDIDNDGVDECLFIGSDRNELIVTRKDYSHPVSILLDDDIKDMHHSMFLQNNTPMIHINMNNYSYLFSYTKNFLYAFRYLVYILTFMATFLMFHFMGKLYQYYLKRQYEDEKRITELQVKAIEQQMSPHFTLNILNSIGNLYENHDKQKAQYYFGKYSKLLRITLISSGEISIPLKDELNFTQSYLELEKLRLNNGFQYHFLDNDHIPDIKVPKFLIQTFVENAVKHGIFPLQGKRSANIQVNYKHTKDHFCITIEDNGIGRELAKLQNIPSTGKGLSILDEILQLYKRFESRSINYKIEDKYPEKEESGTKVTIIISNN